MVSQVSSFLTELHHDLRHHGHLLLHVPERGCRPEALARALQQPHADGPQDHLRLRRGGGADGRGPGEDRPRDCHMVSGSGVDLA